MTHPSRPLRWTAPPKTRLRQNTFRLGFSLWSFFHKGILWFGDQFAVIVVDKSHFSMFLSQFCWTCFSIYTNRSTGRQVVHPFPSPKISELSWTAQFCKNFWRYHLAKISLSVRYDVFQVMFLDKCHSTVEAQELSPTLLQLYYMGVSKK